MATVSMQGQGLYSFMLDTNFYNTYLFVGDQYYGEEKYDSALLMYSIPFSLLNGKEFEDDSVEAEPCLGLFLKPIWGIVNLKLGQVYYYLGEYDIGLGFLFDAEYQLKEIINNDKLSLCYYFLGMIYYKESNFANSLNYYYQSLELLNKIQANNSFTIGLIYSDIGSIWGMQGELQKAKYFFEKAYKILINQDTINHNKLSIIINNIGSINLAIGDFNAAQENYKEAIKLISGSKKSSYSDLSMYNNNLATTYSLQEQYDSAEVFYYKSIDIRRQNIHHPPNVQIAQSYFQLGIISYQKKNYFESLKRAQQSIIWNSMNFIDTSAYINPGIERIMDYSLMGSLFYLKALTFQSLYHYDSTQLHYDKAQEMFNALLDYYENLNKNQIIYEEYKQYAEDIKEGTSSAIEFCYNSNSSSVEKNENIFRLIEKSKSFELYKTLVESRAKKYSNIPDSLIDEERKIRQQLTDCEIQFKIANSTNLDINDPQRYMILIEQRVRYINRLDSIIRYYENEYPKYFKLKYDFSVFSILEVQNQLADSTAILEFYYSDSNIFRIFITPNKSEISIIKKEIIESNLTNHLKGIKFFDNKIVTNTGKRLYENLIGDINVDLLGIKKIIVIPDEELYYLPFGTLISNRTQMNNKVRFLIEDFEFSYHYSTSIWMLSFANKTLRGDSYKHDYLGVAPFSFNGSSEMLEKKKAALPYSKDEVIQTGKNFTNKGYNAEILLAEKATKNAFVQLCPKYNYIHLATHGQYDKENPELSSLFFYSTDSFDQYPQQSLSQKLFIGESFNLSINAEIFVLSSCKSGIGEMLKGEGLITVTRGLLFSGAKNVLYSLWNIIDKPTSILFKTFYENLLNGESPSSALRKAKIEMISLSETSLPALWGGFVIIGN